MINLDELLSDGEGLKPCPFCGGKAQHHSYKKKDCDNKEIIKHNIYCHSEIFSLATKYFETLEEAVDAWNSRHREEKLASICRVLVEALEFYANPPKIKLTTPYASPEPIEYWNGDEAKQALSKAEQIAGE